MSGGFEASVFQAMFDALKPGGILGVVGHRADATIEQDPKAENGYVRQDYTIALAEAPASSSSLRQRSTANPKDRKDYADGVWTIPPTYLLKDVDREQYAAIGESDHMSLKFRKPGTEQPDICLNLHTARLFEPDIALQAGPYRLHNIQPSQPLESDEALRVTAGWS